MSDTHSPRQVLCHFQSEMVVGLFPQVGSLFEMGKDVKPNFRPIVSKNISVESHP